MSQRRFHLSRSMASKSGIHHNRWYMTHSHQSSSTTRIHCLWQKFLQMGKDIAFLHVFPLPDFLSDEGKRNHVTLMSSYRGCSFYHFTSNTHNTTFNRYHFFVVCKEPYLHTGGRDIERATRRQIVKDGTEKIKDNGFKFWIVKRKRPCIPCITAAVHFHGSVVATLT